MLEEVMHDPIACEPTCLLPMMRVFAEVEPKTPTFPILDLLPKMLY
jgi:hypothetical protein